ncbi:MAG: short-chain dehydrogenase/reductase [Rubrobacteraceae bacterium]|nr:short-chain dehydrogenase/reductase [Rubrobacteraceae bacterium]
MMFSEEVAWVTGSSTGIGAATAVALAEAGCRVAVHYNRSEVEAREVVEQISSSGGEAMLVGGDVADAGEVERMAGEIEERYGRLDVLVNNAGSLIERRKLEEMTEDLWDRVMDVNLKSVFLCSKAVLPAMKRQGRGRIINMTSVAARNGGGPGSAAYATAKGGVSTLTRAMAKELVGEGILVNGVAPGIITTPFHEARDARAHDGRSPHWTRGDTGGGRRGRGVSRLSGGGLPGGRDHRGQRRPADGLV